MSFFEHHRVLPSTPQCHFTNTPESSQHSQLHLSTLPTAPLNTPISFSSSEIPGVLFWTSHCPLLTPECPLHTPVSFSSHPNVLLFTPLCPSVHTPISFSSHPYVLLFTPQCPSRHTPVSFSQHLSVLLFTHQWPSLPTSVSFSKYYRVSLCVIIIIIIILIIITMMTILITMETLKASILWLKALKHLESITLLFSEHPSVNVCVHVRLKCLESCWQWCAHAVFLHQLF